MKMTFDEYIQNPMGKDNAVISNRTMYRNLYQSKLDRILVREAGKIDVKTYHDGKRYLCYLKIPSEVIKEFYYDVVIEFTPPKGITGTDLKKYNVRFYSNDPSFAYTFTYAFRKNDLLIKDLEDKLSKKALKNPAKEKNPHNQVGYVKSLYFAYLIMSKRGYFSKLRYVDKFGLSALKKQIMNADEKIKLRQEAAEHKGKEAKKEKIKRIAEKPTAPEIPIKPKIGKVGNIKSISKTTSSIKKVGSIKRK